MSSQFAFMPSGLSQSITVGGAAPATISLVVQGVGSAGTLHVGITATANIIPKCVRISNDGTASAFINFGATAAAVSTSPSIGAQIRNSSEVIFRPGGLPFLAASCASTFTVTLCVTPGDGR